MHRIFEILNTDVDHWICGISIGLFLALVFFAANTI